MFRKMIEIIQEHLPSTRKRVENIMKDIVENENEYILRRAGISIAVLIPYRKYLDMLDKIEDKQVNEN